MQKRAITLILFFCGAAFGQHADILVEVSGGQLVTLADGASGDPNAASCIFETELGELGVPGFSDDPGFNSSTLAGGSLLGFNVVGPLRFWDGVGFVSPPDGEGIQISDAGLSIFADGGSSFVAGFDFAQASGSGSVHQHINFWVQHPSFDEGDPFTNPITSGAYLLPLELTSSVHATSDPFYLLLDGGADPNSLALALTAADAAFCEGTVCPGDVDGNLTVDLTDLAIILANFGASGVGLSDGDLNGDGLVDLSDLAALLAVFGQSC